MAHYWIKFPNVDRPYVKWTTVSDGPYEYAKTQEQFDSLRDREIEDARRHPSRCPNVQRLREELIHAQWDQRQREMDEHGSTSAWKTSSGGWKFESPRQAIVCNRAGKDETTLTYEQFVDWFCSNEEKERPMGRALGEE